MITKLSTGPKHHFFGYYDICPCNSTNQFHLALETDFDDRAPGPKDTAGVGLIDCSNGSFERFAETSAFNLQQGSMMHWISAGHGEEFTFNDWEEGRLVSRAINPQTAASRTIDGAIAAVSPCGTTAIGLNFARMSACRRVVGYANDIYTPENMIPVPEDDGLYRIDLKTGLSELLVPIAAAHNPTSEFQESCWFNHVLFNPGGSRLVFFARMKHAGRWLTSLWAVNLDGTGLECLIEYGKRLSHCAWIDDDTIMISCNVLGTMEFLSFNIQTKEMTEMHIDQFPSNGHNAFSPDCRWIVCDTYPEGEARECRLLLHDRQTQQTHLLGAFHHPEHITGDCRCDLHPRWSRSGKTITFDSVHEGTRQIYAADVSGILADAAT